MNQNPGKKKQVALFSIMQIAYWCSVGSFSSFVVTYLQDARAMSAATVGTMLAVFTAVSFAGQFFWGWIADKWRTNRKVYLIMSVWMMGMCILTYTATSVPLIILFYALLGFAQGSIPVNLDTWILSSFDDASAYGPIRASASFVYAFFALCYGTIIEKLGYGVMPVFTGAFVALSTVCAFLSKDAPYHEKPQKAKVDILHKKHTGKDKLFTRSFIIILIALLCAGIGGSSYQFYALLIARVGGTARHLGFGLFASALSEAPFMFLQRKLMRFSPRHRMMFAGVIYVCSLILFALAKTPEQLIMFNVVNGAAYGILLPATRQIVYEEASESVRMTAQGVANAVYLSLSGIMASTCVSLFADTAGLPFVMSLFAGVQLVGFIPMIFGIRDKKPEE